VPAAVAPPASPPAPAPVAPPPATSAASVADAGDGPAPDPVVDLDGDGRPDRVYLDDARVVRQTANGPLEERLRLESAEDDNHVTAQLAVGGRVLLVVQGSGHEVDHDGPRTRSYTWGSVGVFEFAARGPARLLWEFRSEFNAQDDHEDWRFAAQPDGSLLATSTLGDDGAQGTEVTARLVRNRDGVFEPATCWDASPPASPEPPCETTLAAGGSLRVTERMRPGPNATEVPAGTRVTVLRRGTVRRGAATLSCVRFGAGVVNLGWAFVTDAERARCTPVAR
jgi:hypothetical protein